jgi:multidrug transporter EmrE-like cation transporter
VGSVLALVLFGQKLSPTGWIGLGIAVASVTPVYLRETRQYAIVPSGVRTE